MKKYFVSRWPVCPLLGLLVCTLTAIHAVAQYLKDFIEICSRRTLSVEKIPCRRVPLGEVEDYKPTIVLLPRGELLLSMFTGRRLENGKIAEQAIL